MARAVFRIQNSEFRRDHIHVIRGIRGFVIRDLSGYLTGTFRFSSSNVRVLVNFNHRHPDNVIATLAHELQHALEVAQAPDVKDTATMVALFERIGTVRVRSGSATTYETDGARRIGEQVLRELGAAPKTRGDKLAAKREDRSDPSNP